MALEYITPQELDVASSVEQSDEVIVLCADGRTRRASKRALVADLSLAAQMSAERVTAEEKARQAADTELGKRIDAEASERGKADSAMDALIQQLRTTKQDKIPVWELLWTNANPLSTVLSIIPVDNIMQYDKFRITYAYNKDEGVATAETTIINNPSKKVDELGAQAIYGWLTTFGGKSDEMNIKKRMVTVYQDEHSMIRFSGATAVTIVGGSINVVNDDNNCIPIQIFGIKEKK